MQPVVPVERVARPACAADLRALLDRNVPVLFDGMLDHVPACAAWTPALLLERVGHVAFPVTTAGPDHVPGAGDVRPWPLSDLLATLAQPAQAGVSHYLAGANLLGREAEAPGVGALLDDAAGFVRFLDAPASCLGFWVGADMQRTWLHFDCAHNMMLVLRGSKRFLLAPPSDYPNLYPYTYSSCRGQDNGGEIYRFSEVDALQPDGARHPRALRVRFHEATVGPGQTLLVPLGWFHHVISDGHAEDGLNVALNLFFDATASDWKQARYLKAFQQSYVKKT